MHLLNIKAPAVPLPITIQIGEDTYLLTPTEVDASSKDFWGIPETELKKQTKFFNADTFGIYLDEKVKQRALKFGESIAPGMIQYENHLRKESLIQEETNQDGCDQLPKDDNSQRHDSEEVSGPA